MASGTILGSTSNSYIDAKIEWSSSANTTANKSTVTAALYYKRNNTGYETYGTGTFSITINGTPFSATKVINITGSAWVKAVEGSVAVSHNSDGSKSIAISGAGNMPDTSLTSTSVSGTAKLDTIPRASSLDSVTCSTKYFNGTITCKYTPKSASFYNRCVIALNLNGAYTQVKVINLGQQSASQRTETVTLSETELAIIYNKFPTSINGTLRFTLRTYSDSGYSSQIGDGVYKEIALKIPNISATQPIATMTLSPVSSLPAPLNTLFIKGRTKIDANFTDAEGKYGATITSYKMNVLGKNYGSPFTSEYITTDGNISVTGTITDSRGFSRTYTQTVTVIPYANPRILPASGENDIVCARCDSSGNFSESGTYLRIRAKRSYSKVISGGKQNNFCLLRYRYKTENGSYSSWVDILTETSTSDEIDTGAILGGALLATKSYTVEVGVIDSLKEYDKVAIHIPTDKVYMHEAGSINSFGFGKYAEEPNTFDIADDITAKFRGKVMFPGEAWLNLGLSDNVAESETNCGRWGGTGCYYRVTAGEKHIYVAFNCAFSYANAALQVNKDPIPAEYRPARNAYALCATGGRAVARILVNKSGHILVDWIQVISSAEQTTASTVKWIDGYIDYWI
jgi:hypothetical protein